MEGIYMKPKPEKKMSCIGIISLLVGIPPLLLGIYLFINANVVLGFIVMLFGGAFIGAAAMTRR